MPELALTFASYTTLMGHDLWRRSARPKPKPTEPSSHERQCEEVLDTTGPGTAAFASYSSSESAISDRSSASSPTNRSLERPKTHASGKDQSELTAHGLLRLLRTSTLATAAVLLIAGTRSGNAAAVNLSLSRNDILDRMGDPTFVAGLDIASDPFGALGPFQFSVGGGLEVGASGSFWAGGGPIVVIPLDAGFLLGLSVMPGLYNNGSGVDLGFPVEFRSRLGIAREIRPDWWFGLAIEHKSNAGFSTTNPGVETLSLTLARHF